MPYILRLDSSARVADSHSRWLADAVEAALVANSPALSVRRRDLATMSLPHIADKTIAGFYTPAEAITPELKAATALSDELIEELKSAEALIISAPMYNFGPPSALKAWIDQIVRINATFSYDGTSFTGLVPVRRAYLALAYGADGYSPGAPFAAMNFLEPYLVSLMGFLGIGETKVFRIEGTTGDATAVDRLRNSVAADIRALTVSASQVV